MKLLVLLIPLSNLTQSKATELVGWYYRLLLKINHDKISRFANGFEKRFRDSFWRTFYL
jgi:hypothetical protein